MNARKPLSEITGWNWLIIFVLAIAWARIWIVAADYDVVAQEITEERIPHSDDVAEAQTPVESWHIGRERPECTLERQGHSWAAQDSVDVEICNGHLWVETPNAGVNMLQPWAVFVLYAGGNAQILLFQDGNEASLQARAISGLDLKLVECVAIYHKGDLMDVDPPSCNVRER